MKCMHCRENFHEQERTTFIGKDVDKAWAVRSYECPACERLNLLLVNAEEWQYYQHGSGGTIKGVISAIPIRPRGSNRPPCPPEVPPTIAGDYNEASLVLPDSSKASAALSRRCLQTILRETAKVKPGNLANEIQEVIDAGMLPTYLVEMIDAVRQIGNFAAHPMKSQHTGEILPVDPVEAEWNLDVLEALFDFFYVQPALIAKKRTALNAKLKDAGKPPMK